MNTAGGVAVGFRRAVEHYFEIRERGSSVKTEVMAGVSTFLVLSYIFAVNPAILSDAGMDRDAVLLATIVVSGVATIAMGMWARLPFVLAPGMEMNAYVAYLAVGIIGLTWQQALGAVFWSGVLFVVMTATGMRQKIIDGIPARMQTGLSFAVGVFLILVAGKVTGILRYSGVTLVGIGPLFSGDALVLYLTTITAVALDRRKVKSAVLVSVLVGTVTARMVGARVLAESGDVGAGALNAVGALDLSVITDPRALNVILVLFVVDFYGSVAKIIGITGNTSIRTNGAIPRMRQALLVDSVGTTAAAALGSTNITVYVESSVGVGAGGRTGLVAVVCGVLMLSCFVLAPVIHLVPLAATTGALVLVATKLMPTRAELRASGGWDLAALAAMQLVVIVSFAVDRAILAGLSIHALAGAIHGRRANGYMVISIVLLLLGVVFQHVRT